MSILLIKNYFDGSTRNKAATSFFDAISLRLHGNNYIVIRTNYNFLAKGLFTSRLDKPSATVLSGISNKCFYCAMEIRKMFSIS